MLPYFVITGLIAVLAYIMPPRRLDRWLWVIAFLVILVFVGLRHHVGMDWNNYLIMIERAASGSLMNAFNYAEPGYAILLWVSGQLGFGVYGSNLVGSLIFTLGLFRYASTTQSPWIALLVAMPMLVIVVAMSANRQAVAIGVLLWAIAIWGGSGWVKRATYVVIASMFHFSAIIFMVFVMIDLPLRRGMKIAMTSAFLSILIIALQWSGYADYYDSLYLTGQSEMTKSKGALMHVFFNAGPVLLLLLFPEKYRTLLLPNQLHRYMAYMAVLLIPGALLFSAASGRISLYLFPVSMYVFAAMPQLTASFREQNFIRYALVLFMLGVLYVWLGFANSSDAHLPYANLLTVSPGQWVLCCE